MINGGYQDIYGPAFDYVITNRDVSDDEFIEVFNQNRITSLRVKLFPQGRLLSRDAKIMGDLDLNSAWINGWNTDTSETYEVVLKAPGRGGVGDLRRSPLAVSLINVPVKEILELNYWSEEDGVGTMSRTDLRKLRVQGLDRRTQPITGIDRLLLDLRNRSLKLEDLLHSRYKIHFLHCWW